MTSPDRLILAGGPGERRIALLAGDAVLGFAIDRGDPAVGDILLGRVLAKPPGGGATFVEIGAALPGYLPRPGDWHEGQALPVQVTAEARGGKGAVLTNRITRELPDVTRMKAPARLIAPSRLARLLADNPGVSELLVDEPSLLPEARKAFPGAELKRGIWRDSGAADALDLALSRIVPLPGGARLIIDESAAATLIDIDAGGAQRDAANRAAMDEIARQLRLRNIAGQIIVDPIAGGDLQELVALLKTALAEDPIDTDVLGLTRMRMIELVRTRRQPSLSEYFLSAPQPQRSAASLALEALQAILAEAEAAPHRTLALVAAPAIIHYLQSRPDLIAETQTRLGRPLALDARDGETGFIITDKRP